MARKSRITMKVSADGRVSDGTWPDANPEQVEVAKVVMNILTFSANPKADLIEWAKAQPCTTP